MLQTRALLMCVFCLLASVVGAAADEPYPNKIVRIVVSYPAGGAADLIVRAVSARLETTGYHIVIENRSGGATQVAAETVMRSPADGYTLFATGMETFAINPFIYSQLAYDPDNSFVPVSGLAYSNQILVVPPESPIKDIPDLIQRAKTASSPLQYGTIGVGGSAHINMILFENLAHVKMDPIHFRGGAPLLTDLMGGHVSMGFLSVTLLYNQIAAGQLRALGVSSTKRLAKLPNVPTIDESGVKGYEAVSWFGLFAPKGTPQDIVDKLNADVQKVFADASFKEQFLEPSFLEPITGDTKQFTTYVDNEKAKWKHVLTENGFKIN
jgi:tripartite-type tricarboxylate transporter receptor subunit TctC